MVKQAVEEIKKEEAKKPVAQKPVPALGTAAPTVTKTNPVVAKKKFTVNANGKKVPVASTISKPVSNAKAVPATAAAKIAAAKTVAVNKVGEPGKIQQTTKSASHQVASKPKTTTVPA